MQHREPISCVLFPWLPDPCWLTTACLGMGCRPFGCCIVSCRVVPDIISGQGRQVDE
ncbi:hypothetical protein LY78DRAFT_221144 [Colletotrichum sublineola]|nr:hypothetical protein LY78DRAFT_221144 [Colletotrichum sublineola]